MRDFLRRAPDSGCGLCPLKAGLGGLLAVGLMGLLAEFAVDPWLIAPLAASSVMVFASPDNPMAQPANVVGGHVLSTAVALALDAVLPGSWWAVALGVGLVIALMGLTRLTHPPAGADALVVLTIHPGPVYLLAPILVGSIALVALAVAVHRLLPPKRIYPAPAE